MIFAKAMSVVVETPGDSGLELGQILVAVAAIAVGLMTVYAANKRHRQQLAHDRLLRAEELEHDREMRRRDQIRDTMDTAMESVNEATRALARLAGALLAVEESRSPLEATLANEDADGKEQERAEEALEELRQELQEPLSEAHHSTMEMITNQSRLAVRLGRGHSVVAAAEEAATCYRQLYDNLRIGLQRNRTKEERDFEEKYVEEEIDPKARAFLSECEQWFQGPSGIA